MDPLSTLSVVANVIAVVDFSCQVVRIGRQIYEDGSTSRQSELKRVGADVQVMTSALNEAIRTTAGSSKPSKRDQQLISLASETAKIGAELSSLVAGVQGDVGAAGSRRNAAKATLRTLWSQSEIEKTERRLQTVRDELLFEIVADLRCRSDLTAALQSANFQVLNDQTKKLFQSIISNQDSLDSLVDLQFASERRAEMRHDQLLQSLEALRHYAPPPKSKTWQSTGSEDARTTTRRDLKALGTIVQSLRYPTMEERQDSIGEAHERTLRWIFCNPTTSQKPWDDFSQFLRFSSGIYWISGKAGSGKSTLMKYIQQHPDTDTILDQWASDTGKTLVRSSFYFFYHGTDMQKTEDGLLRSLLYYILQTSVGDESRIAFARHALPSRFERATQDRMFVDDFTKWELRRAIENVVAKSHDMCFFFLVDGLDEFNASAPDMALLVEFFSKLAKSPRVKIILSSRPLQVFEDSLAHFPRVRVQDLTYGDIRIYVEDKLYPHPRMQRLKAKRKDEAAALVHELVRASSGVFLWVSLVVTSFLEGLGNGDDISDLRQRLTELPSEINDLYLVMLKRIPPRYRHQTARLLQLVFFGTKDSTSLSALGLWYASEVDVENLMATPVSPLTQEEEIEALEDVERRLKSRCFGMVEVQLTERRKFLEESHDLAERPIYEPYTCDCAKYVHTVAFIHRSATEFLQQESVWEQFVQHQTESGFDPIVSLLISSVYCIKKLRFVNSHDGIDTLREMIMCAAFRMRLAEVNCLEPQTNLVDHLDKSVKMLILQNVHCTAPLPYGPSGECLRSCGLLKAIRKQHWSAIFYDRHTQPKQSCSLLSFAVSSNWRLYVEAQFLRVGTSLAKKTGWPLLLFALYGEYPKVRHNDAGWVYDSDHGRMIQVLVQNGCDPDEQFEGKTATQWRDKRRIASNLSARGNAINDNDLRGYSRRETLSLDLPFAFHVSSAVGSIDHQTLGKETKKKRSQRLCACADGPCLIL